MNEPGSEYVRQQAQGQTLAAVLQGMAVGDKVAFPAARAMAVRASASGYGFAWGRSFKTKADRASRSIIVERVE